MYFYSLIARLVWQFFRFLVNYALSDDSTNVSVNHLLLNCKRVVSWDSTSNRRFISSHRRNISLQDFAKNFSRPSSFLLYIRNNPCFFVAIQFSFMQSSPFFRGDKNKRENFVFIYLAEEKINTEKPLVYQQLSIVYSSISVVYLISHLSTN